MVVYAGIYPEVDANLFVRVSDTVGDAQALGVGPGDLPELLRWAPHAAQAAGAFAQVGLGPPDTHGDDLVVATARVSRAGPPWDRLDDEFDSL